MALHDTRFRDVAQRETKERHKLLARKAQIEKRKADNAPISSEEWKELARIDAVLKIVCPDHVSQQPPFLQRQQPHGQSSQSQAPQNSQAAAQAQQTQSQPSQSHNSSHQQGQGFPPEVLDPLFVGVRQLFFGDEGQRRYTLLSHDDGVLIFAEPAVSGKSAALHADEPAVVLASLTFGLLDIDQAEGPPVEIAGQATPGGYSIVPDTDHHAWNALTQAFYAALGEAKGLEALARLVLPILTMEGDPDGSGGRRSEVNASEFANVMRELHRRGVTPNEIMLRRRVNEALNRFQHVNDAGPYARITTPDTGINPPDLEAIDRFNLVPDNIRLMGPMIVAAMFDQMKAFQCLDYCVEANQRGELVLGSGDAGRRLYQYWRDAPNRMSEMERRTFYAMTLGLPGGDPGTKRNTYFNPGILHLASSVSELVRRYELDNIVRARIPAQIGQQQVRKAARDLAANLSLHGYGMAYYAALELQGQVNFVIDVLSDPEIMANFGARDIWQVVDQIATLHLGGALNTLKYQTLATCGTIITAWLANNTNRIMSATGPLIDMVEVNNPPPHPPGRKAITHPNDYDLVNACELWLADSGISDVEAERLAQVRETPTQTSRPIQLPSVVQEMLGDMGDLGVSFAHR
jgi:hypothetical protein